MNIISVETTERDAEERSTTTQFHIWPAERGAMIVITARSWQTRLQDVKVCSWSWEVLKETRDYISAEQELSKFDFLRL